MGNQRESEQSRNSAHTHKYIKVMGTYVYVWRCADPGCVHFVYKPQEFIISGRYSICWGCGLRFIMDDKSMEEDMPRCLECRNPSIKEMDPDDFMEHIQKKLRALGSTKSDDAATSDGTASVDRPESEEV
jgi:hypothetical protein